MENAYFFTTLFPILKLIKLLKVHCTLWYNTNMSITPYPKYVLLISTHDDIQNHESLPLTSSIGNPKS